MQERKRMAEKTTIWNWRGEQLNWTHWKVKIEKWTGGERNVAEKKTKCEISEWRVARPKAHRHGACVCVKCRRRAWGIAATAAMAFSSIKGSCLICWYDHQQKQHTVCDASVCVCVQPWRWHSEWCAKTVASKHSVLMLCGATRAAWAPPTKIIATNQTYILLITT